MRTTILLFLIFSITGCYRFGPNSEARTKLHEFETRLKDYKDHFVTYRRRMFPVQHIEAQKRIYYLGHYFDLANEDISAIQSPEIQTARERVQSGIAFLNYWLLYIDPYYDGDSHDFEKLKPHLQVDFQEKYDQIPEAYRQIITQRIEKKLKVKDFDLTLFILEPATNNGKFLLDLNKVCYEMLLEDLKTLKETLKKP